MIFGRMRISGFVGKRLETINAIKRQSCKVTGKKIEWQKNLSAKNMDIMIVDKQAYLFSSSIFLRSSRKENLTEKKQQTIQKQQQEIHRQKTKKIFQEKARIDQSNKRINDTRKNNIRIRAKLNNPSQFLLSSKFHLQGIKTQSLVEKVQKLRDNILSAEMKEKLIQKIVRMRDLNQQIFKKQGKKDIRMHFQSIQGLRKINEEGKPEEMSKHLQKDMIPAFNLMNSYSELTGIIETILQQIEEKETFFQLPLFFHKIMLEIVRDFNMLQFYPFYLLKLVENNDKETQNKRKISSNQAHICAQIVKHIGDMQYEWRDNKINYDLQKYFHLFFTDKLSQIVQSISKPQKNTQNTDHNQQQQLHSFFEKISFLSVIQKIFSQTHLTYGKHNFYKQFIHSNLPLITSLAQKVKSLEVNAKQVQKIVQLWKMGVVNMVLDDKIRNCFESYLKNVAQTHLQQQNDSSTNPKYDVSLINCLNDVYSTIGKLPTSIYNEFLSQYHYETFSLSEYHLIQSLKFFIYSECQDLTLLQYMLQKLDTLINYRSKHSDKGVSNVNRKSKNMLHLLGHYMAIKYQAIAKSEVGKRLLHFCSPKSNKDMHLLQRMLEHTKKYHHNQIKSNRLMNDPNSNPKTHVFISSCITYEPKHVSNYHTVASKLSTLQQKMFRQSLSRVVKQINTQNSNDSNKVFYEIKQNFSFCSFQLDFVVLKWNSINKQQLLGYLDVECVGLQYSQDTFQGTNDELTSQKMIQMSLEEYEKGLKLIRKKIVRQDILCHYNWKILYIPNKFLYTRHIPTPLFQSKLKEAIFNKLSD